MSAIRLINDVPVSVAPMIEFRLFQGTNQVARLGVHAGASASLPTTSEYAAQAFTTLGEFSLASNTLNFSDTSAVLLAQVLEEDGFYDFQLVQSTGSRPGAITCENTWRSPVQFKLTRPNSPFEIVTIVDEHNNASISTAQQWTAYAIVNGITSATVTITDPNARITATSDNNDDGVTLTVS